MSTDPIRTEDALSRDTFGKLIFARAQGPGVAVTPVRSFPIRDPEHGIALIGPDGQEVAWIDDLASLDAEPLRLIRDELAQREFNPRILRIRSASSWATPSHWSVETDRGPAGLTLRSEDDIRRLSSGALLIADAHGVQFLIADTAGLDKASRRILDHFL